MVPGEVLPEGGVATRRSQPELTQWAFRRAFALNPDLPIAHNHYTQIEADSGHAQAAMVRLLGQAEKHPNDPELFSGLVQATRFCGLLEESLKAHRRARRLDSKAVTSVAHTFFLLGDYQRTLEWYPPGSRFYLDVAALAAAGRETEAAELLAQRSFGAPDGRLLAFLPPGRSCQEHRGREACTRTEADTGSRNQILPGTAVGTRRSGS